MTDSNSFDVIIIGGSYAGLSAAMALGRSLRKVLLIDSGLPCNRQTPHSHNFITQDGKTPNEISTLAQQQVEKYGTVRFYAGLAINGIKIKGGFEIELQSKEAFRAKKIIFATGIRDIFPDIQGFAECWGISVIHCPYCHGYEFHHKKTAILANGERAFHLATLVNNLTDDLTILTTGNADFNAEQKDKLEKHHIGIIENEIAEIVHHNGQVKQLIFKDGVIKAFDAVYAAIPFVQHSDILEKLGCKLTEQGFIEVSSLQETSIPGIYACGDNSTFMRSVANAVATGNLTGAMINKALCDENF